MATDSAPSARESALERVAAGEAVDEVAVRFNIAPAKLRKWAGVDDDRVSGSSSAKMRPRGGQATILDIAQHAGLSKSVVSRALRGQYGVSSDARARVERAVEELGYVSNAAAQNLSSYRTNTIGVLVRDASAAFYGEMQSALQRRGTAIDQRVFITSGALDNNDERRALEDLIALRVDGLIVCSGRLPLDEVKRFSGTIPVVVAGRPDVDPAVHSVFGDEDDGVELLARHLLDRGDREVAVLQPSISVSPILHRRAGRMADALRRGGAHATVRPVDDPRGVAGGLDSLPDDVTAVMAPNDRYAVAVLEAMEVTGRRRAVTGFDGVGGLFSELIGLTTWRQPVEEIGSEAVDLLLRVVAGREDGIRHIALPGSVRVSRSTS